MFAAGRTLFLALGLTALGCQTGHQQVSSGPSQRPPVHIADFHVPTDSALPPGELGVAVKAGRADMNETTTRLKPYVGAGLNCASCHIGAGTHPDAAPFVGTFGLFPNYSKRSGQIETLENRLNDCFERSENGKPLAVDSVAMKDMVAYIAWLSKDVPVGMKVKGHGIAPIQAPDKPDRQRGESVYNTSCVVCHGAQGAGGAMAPPLWGARSFNVAAGMARLNTMSAFIKHNMPLGKPESLSAQEAYDVASFVLAHPRPDFPAKTHDWPKGGKPSDAAY
jgi:thiosulfate dehydrogenase